MRGPTPSPGSLGEGLLFFAGVLVAIIGVEQLLVHGLAAPARSRVVAAWVYPMAVGFFALPAAFEVAQARHVRRDLLFARETGVVGPFAAGAAAGLLYCGLCLADPVYRWLPALPVLVAGACILSFVASRALWKDGER